MKHRRDDLLSREHIEVGRLIGPRTPCWVHWPGTPLANRPAAPPTDGHRTEGRANVGKKPRETLKEAGSGLVLAEEGRQERVENQFSVASDGDVHLRNSLDDGRVNAILMGTASDDEEVAPPQLAKEPSDSRCLLDRRGRGRYTDGA